jgi:hypothetical protein
MLAAVAVAVAIAVVAAGTIAAFAVVWIGDRLSTINNP